jgi:hypothetical protein
MRRAMDEETFRQELTGQFVLAGGLCFPSFARAIHVSPGAVYDAALPLCWSLDFNVNPMCSGLLQRGPDPARAFRVIHEFTLADSSTEAACEAFLEWCEAHGVPSGGSGVRVYGDPTGNARDSTSAQSDWAIVRQRLHNLEPSIRVARSPWPVKDTVNAVRARLMNASGQAGMVIHPSCKRLIRDLEEALWPSDLMDQHALAWLRYFAVWEYPLLGARPPGDGRIVSG